ncbi:DUF6221 family protein [Streptomyces sp. NPDC127114]|uniref:DUF6221 family protein n=1 Tax=Streptomyces sp. NPDC127114 TaxID=3345366 RepID=UPI0036326FA3
METPQTDPIQEIFDFVNDQLDADERVAREVGYDRIEAVDYLWGSQHLLLQQDQGESKTTIELPAGLAQHIARHDPVRVMSEAAFKRAVLEVYRPRPVEPSRQEGAAEIPQMLRLLAAPYASQPGYQERWRL